MSESTPRQTKDWAEQDDSDDDAEEMRRQFGSPVKGASGQEEDGQAPDSSLKDDAPVASLLSRISGLSTDPPPESSTSQNASSSTPTQPPPPRERPRPNTSGALFGKALAGVKSDRSSAPAPSIAKEKEDDKIEPVTETPVVKEEKEDKMTTNLMDSFDDMGSANGHKEDANMSNANSGLISNEFEVQVKLADLQADPNSPLYSIKAFEDLPLHPDLLKGIYGAGFKKPSKIQEKALPMLLNNPPRNLIGQSQSGTGKTAAFTLNMLSRVDPALQTPQAICLAPTRELARQIQEVIDKIGQHTSITTFLAVSGSWSRSVRIDKHILIGTAGTLVDMLSRGGRIFDAKQIRVFVLDEADQMIAMQGLGDQTTRIKRALPPGVQNVLFSATFPDEVQTFAAEFAPEANQIFLRKEEVTVDAIKQLYLECDGEDQKYEALSSLYDCMTIGQSIVFCKRRDTADKLAQRLTDDGHSVAALHGEKQTQDRDDLLDGFRNGKTKVLITTNVLARGIDIQQVNMVVNYDVPDMGPEAGWRPDVETYIHRIGRTGRFGRKGCSVIFVHDDRSRRDVEELQDATGKRMKRIDARRTGDLEQLEKALKIAMKGPN